jgi:probable rRNA maturation factor
MAKLFIDCEQGDYTLLADAVYKVLGQTDDLMAEIITVSAQEIRALNKDTRGIDKVTDVLSYPTLDGIRGKVVLKKDFPLDVDDDKLMLGSIVLCLERIKEQAQEIGHSEQEEREYLIVHGLMHLFGYDHMTDEDKKQMREKEKAVMVLLGKN